MERVVIRERTLIPPFGEPARDLRILNKPLWLLQRDLLNRHCKGSREVDSLDEVPDFTDEELLVYKDNLFFNNYLIDTFIEKARATKEACQIAFNKGDKSIEAHALRLQDGIRQQSDGYVADLYYFPPGKRRDPKPLRIDTQSREMGYYHVPRYMAPTQGDLVFHVPVRAFLSIENWVHVFLANTPLGVFSWARDIEDVMDRSSVKRIRHWSAADWRAFGYKLTLVLSAFWERMNPFEERWRNHFLACKKMVKVGKNCSIDPTAIIHGPTIIGDNVYIGPGTVIANSYIGNNVNIMQGCQIMLSVVSDRCFLPFNAALFMSSLMENTIVAQNTTMQLGVVGRNTFIGANNVFTDFNLLSAEELKTFHKGRLEQVGLSVIGSAVGHNCKIGSGFVFYPARMIGSNTVLIYDDDEGRIRENIPGLSPDEVDEETGEPRRIVYHWPRIYHADNGESRTMSMPVEQSDSAFPQALQISAHRSSKHVLR